MSYNNDKIIQTSLVNKKNILYIGKYYERKLKKQFK